MDQQPQIPNWPEQPSENHTMLPPTQAANPVVQQAAFAAPGKRPVFRRLLLVALCLLVVLSGVVYLILHHKKQLSTSAGTNSQTLLYSDGKTILWQSNGVHTDTSVNDYAKYVQGKLADLYPAHDLKSGNWRIVTTLDYTLQKEAEAQYAAQTDVLKAAGLKHGAMVAEAAKTGQIVSWVNGSPDGTSVPMTRTLPGSLMIPLTFAAAMNANPSITSATMYSDAQGPLAGWPCTSAVSVEAGGNCLYDYDRVYRGSVTVAQALGGLRPVPTINAALAAGLITDGGNHSDMQTLTQLTGNDRAFTCYFRQADGGHVNKIASNETPCRSAAYVGEYVYSMPLDLLAAYATLANDGQFAAQTGIQSITHDGKRVYAAKLTLKRVVRSEVAQTVNGVLADPTVSTVKTTGKFMMQNNSPVSIVIGMDDAADSANGNDSPTDQASAMLYNKDYVVGMWATGEANANWTGTSNGTLSAAEGWLNKALSKS
jgi:membrane peptidoglycan carboxypeptidase